MTPTEQGDDRAKLIIEMSNLLHRHFQAQRKATVEAFANAQGDLVNFITADRKRLALEAVKAYEDDLLSTIDDISNKPWRAARHIRELYENTDSGISDWYKEVADDWGLLEEFFSNGGMSKVRELMADPKFNVNYPERIAELKAQQEEL